MLFLWECFHFKLGNPTLTFIEKNEFTVRTANKLDEKGSNNLEKRPTFVPSKHAKEAPTFYSNAVDTLPFPPKH